MNVFQVFHSMVSQQSVRDHLVLHNGQIVNATLLDMFANGDAKISIQGHIVRAKLETPMAKGEHTFMQVQSFHNGIVVMKLLASNEESARSVPDNNINQLLKNVELPQNAAWRGAIQQMMQRNIPLLPNILQNGAELFGKQPTTNQLQTWFTMLERNIPISADSFRAVHQLLYGSPVNILVTELKKQVQQVLKEWGSNLVPSPSSATSSPSSATSSPFPSSATTTPAPTHPSAANMNQTPSAAGIPLEQMTAEQTKANHDSRMQQLPVNSVWHAANSNRSEELIGQLFKLSKLLDEISDTAKQVLPSVSTSSEWASSKSQESPIIHLMKLFGHQHEKQAANLLQSSRAAGGKVAETAVISKEGQFNLPIENAKQLLIQLSANPQYPQAIKEMAQQLLHNITGQQLLSLPQDQQTMYQSIMVQIPVEWGENQQDTLTLQVQGRKDKKTIDPSNCSIYLDLHPPNLGDLGVFVHIVSKVVSIKLFSENQQIKPMAEQMFPLLKQGLSEQGYLLSFVRIENPQQETKAPKAISAYRKVPAKGIDIRV